MLQNVVVLILVAAAGAYLVRRLLRNAQGHSDGGRDKCAGGEGRKPVR
jgi:hypothetical protein